MCFLLLELEAIPGAVPLTDDAVSWTQNNARILTNALTNILMKVLINVLTKSHELVLKFDFTIFGK